MRSVSQSGDVKNLQYSRDWLAERLGGYGNPRENGSFPLYVHPPEHIPVRGDKSRV